MRIKMSLVVFLMILTPVVVIAANDMVYQDKATEDAANLVTKYTLSDDAEREGYLKQLEGMTVKNPNNNNVRSMYANILIADKKYSLGLEQLKIVNKVNPKPSSKLTECMLVERNGKEARGCYKDAVSIFEKKHKDDDNYVIALYLSNDPRFEVEKNKLVSTGRLTETEEKMLSMSRSELISSIFP